MNRRYERGSIVLMTAVLLPVLIFVLGLATDFGIMYAVRNSAQNAADAFKIRRVARTLEDRQEVWDGPVFYCTLLAALFAEWVLRKKCRLV